MNFSDTHHILGDSYTVKVPDYISVTLLYFTSIMKFASSEDIGFSEITTRSFPFVGKHDEKTDVYFLLKKYNDNVHIYAKIKTATDDVTYQIHTNKGKLNGIYNNFVKSKLLNLIDNITFGENILKRKVDNNKFLLSTKSNKNSYNYALHYGCDGTKVKLRDTEALFFEIAQDILDINVNFVSKEYKIKNMNSILIKSESITTNINGKLVKCQLCIVDTGIEYKYYLEPLNDPNNRYEICNLTPNNNTNVMPNITFNG